MLVCVFSHLLLLHPFGQITSGITAAQRGSQTAQHALLSFGQVIVQLVQLLREGCYFGVHGDRRHWG